MKKLLLSFALLAAIFNCCAMEQKPLHEKLDKNIENRLKYGGLSFLEIQTPCRTLTAEGKFSMVTYLGSRFNSEGTVFPFKLSGNEYLCFNQQGDLVSDLVNRDTCYVPLALNTQAKSYRPGFTTVKNYFCDLKTQVLSHRDGQVLKVCVSREYPQTKSSQEMFIFENPVDPVSPCTAPGYAEGLVWAITAPFPVDCQQGTMEDDQFDDYVMEYVEQNKHVCLFKINGKKLELLRDLGKFPYCVGAYVNPQKTMVAVLHGDNINEPKSLKFITINALKLLDSALGEKSKNQFSDVLVMCEK